MHLQILCQTISTFIEIFCLSLCCLKGIKQGPCIRAYFIAWTKFHHVASCRNSSWVQDNSAQKYKKEILWRSEGSCAVSQEHVLLVNNYYQQKWSDDCGLKVTSTKRTEGHWKKGNIKLSSQAEKANMRLHISAFLQKNSLSYKINNKSG